ncbi:MAG: M56 family metallopeptidase [Planctomycetia bacterium]|nr:M56 family metallopeptidase [Planctomycetia bacterium]
MAEKLLLWLLITSIQMGVLTLVVSIAVRLSSRLSAEVRYLLFFLIFVKVLIPPSWTGSWTISRWCIDPILVQSSIYWSEESGTVPVTEAISEEQFEERTTNRGTGYVCSAHRHSPDEATLLQRHELARNGYFLPLLFLWITNPAFLFTVWLIGFLLCWGYFLWNYSLILNQLGSSERVTRGRLHRKVRCLSVQLGLRRSPALMISRSARFPFVVGLFRSTVVLPTGLADGTCSEATLENALLHELTHFKRWDIQAVWFAMFVQSIFWFHPLLWWAGQRLCHWRELACDETSLNSQRTSPLDYAQTLLDTLRISRGKTGQTGPSLGILERNSQLQYRFELIMNYQEHPRRFNWRELALLVVFVALIFPMGTFSLSHEKSADASVSQSILSTPFEFKIMASYSDLTEHEVIEEALRQEGVTTIRMATPCGRGQAVIGASWTPITDSYYRQIRNNDDFVFRRATRPSPQSTMEILVLDFDQEHEIDLSCMTRLEEKINPGHRNEILFTLNERGGKQMQRLTGMYVPKDGLSARRYMAGVRSGVVHFGVAIVDQFERDGSICFEDTSE